MTTDVQEAETLLIETLLSALDARESARLGGSSMLVHLADMLVHRVREELDELHDPAFSGGGAPGAGPTRQSR